MRFTTILLLALAGCATTTGGQIASLPVHATASTPAPPQTVASCITEKTPGLYSAIQAPIDGGILVTWRLEPVGPVASFTIRAQGSGSVVEQRQIASIGRQVDKVRGCYASGS